MDLVEKYINDFKLFKKDFLKNGKINIVNYSGEPLIVKAAKEGRIDIIRFMIKNEANLNLCQFPGETAAMKAYRNNHEKIFKLLIENGCDFKYRNKNNMNVFEAVLNDSNKKLVDFILLHGAKPIDAHFNYWCSAGYLDIIKSLYKKDYPVNNDHTKYKYPIIRAVENNHLSTVEFLIKNKANLEVKNFYGQTPIHLAAKNNNFEILKLLVENNANMAILDFKGNSCLDFAIEHENERMINYIKKTLQKKGLEVL